MNPCWKCQAEVPPEAKFCGACGAQIAAKGERPEKITHEQQRAVGAAILVLGALVWLGFSAISKTGTRDESSPAPEPAQAEAVAKPSAPPVVDAGEDRVDPSQVAYAAFTLGIRSVPNLRKTFTAIQQDKQDHGLVLIQVSSTVAMSPRSVRLELAQGLENNWLQVSRKLNPEHADHAWVGLISPTGRWVARANKYGAHADED
jgi:hypothetical protein